MKRSSTVVITMAHNSSLLAKVQRNFPQFCFHEGSSFRWSPKNSSIYYPVDSFTDAELLHELAHAVLEHHNYTQDIELLHIERQAWEYATNTLGAQYSVIINPSLVDELMDTYRDWLHARSLCPACLQTSLQTKTGTYQCLNCGCQWRANEARVCMLRKYKI